MNARMLYPLYSPLQPIKMYVTEYKKISHTKSDAYEDNEPNQLKT